MFRLLYPLYGLVKALGWVLEMGGLFLDWLWDWVSVAEHSLRFHIDRAKARKGGKVVLKSKSSLPFPFQKIKV